jgi:hypothetical protein
MVILKSQLVKVERKFSYNSRVKTDNNRFKMVWNE